MSDRFHDTDPTGELLAEWIARDLAPVLASRATGVGRPIVLVRAASKRYHQVTQALLASAIAVEHDAEIVAFHFEGGPSVRTGLRGAIRGLLARLPGGAARLDPSGGFADRTVAIHPDGAERARAQALTRAFLSGGPDLAAVEKFSIDDLNIGALAMDKHVASGNPRVIPGDDSFRDRLESMAADALALARFIRSNEVLAVVLQAAGLDTGLAGRVATAMGLPAFPGAIPDGLYRLTAERPYWGHLHRSYRARLDRLDPEQRATARSSADRHLAASLGSEGTATASIGQASSWARRPVEPGVLPDVPAERRRILVACHSFADTPLAMGPWLFPGLFAWLEHLVDLSDRTDHLWLVKLHPDRRDRDIGVREAVEALVAGHPNVILIPSETSHWALLDHRIDLALTVYGTIAVEYPYLGVPVMLAWPEAPTSDFGFALNPGSVEEYDAILMDPTRWRIPVPREEILDYTYAHWLWPDRAGTPFVALPFLDGRHADFAYLKSDEFIKDWAREVGPHQTQQLLEALRRWVRSESYSYQDFWLDDPRARA